ncbi:hypothetical protein SNOG_06269 [Parastagonospora nodorum SN15]|uniref:Uncharacterized protein n=1 Tax=Phaeosphaeria nodorum (strain SN15 / ATCC MYA-4574 / FGSC 10173) TaxID=321614 RepID=Q0UPP5_PHANO|nr:hypothetical protein SNOG_06269 [Parastagonospora nodorum SN15]EAT86100.1 hypothetical protein SNOG_06269 [Parastagonospora nodorum SN15]
MRDSDEPAQFSSGQSTELKKLCSLSPEAILWNSIVPRSPPCHCTVDMIKSNSKYKKWQDAEIIDRIAITSEMLQQYKELRGSLERSEEIQDIEQNAIVWDFLNVAARKEYPALYSALSKNQDLGSKGDQNLDHGGNPNTHNTTTVTKNTSAVCSGSGCTRPSTVLSTRNAPASSSALPSTSSITLVFKDIFMKDGKAKKANNSPHADHERVQRLPDYGAPSPNTTRKAAGSKVTTRAPLNKRPVAEPAKTNKRKASPNVEQKDVVKAKKSAVGKVHIKKKWSKEEHNILFHTINEWCHKNGVDKLEMKAVNQICFDALAATGSSREKSIVASKTKNMGRNPSTSSKRPKTSALHVEDFPQKSSDILLHGWLPTDWLN